MLFGLEDVLVNIVIIGPESRLGLVEILLYLSLFFSRISEH